LFGILKTRKMITNKILKVKRSNKMKRFLALLLCFTLTIFCVSCNTETTTSVAQNSTENTTVSTTVTTSNTEPISETTTAIIPTETDELPDFSTTTNNDKYFINELAFQLVNQLENNENIIVETVNPIYISQEYINELEYNSQENVYYGYKLSDVDPAFGDVQYAFTVENGETVAVPLGDYVADTTLSTIIKNTAIGTGVIVFCVTLSIVTGGAGTPVAVTAAHTIFTCAATTAASGAAIGIATGGLFTGATELAGQLSSGEKIDWAELGKATALGASDGFKWGAIVGAVTGGVQGAYQISSTAKNVGSYGDLKTTFNGTLKEAGEEIHHVIPKSVSNSTENATLAIKLPTEVHKALESTGSSSNAIGFRANMKSLIDAGKIKEAYTMGIDDILTTVNKNPQFKNYLPEILGDITNFKALTGLF
jgi:hypothetical protein